MITFRLSVSKLKLGFWGTDANCSQQNSILHSESAKRDLKCAYCTYTMVSCAMMGVNSLIVVITHNIYMHEIPHCIPRLYTIFICQLHFTKAEIQIMWGVDLPLFVCNMRLYPLSLVVQNSNNISTVYGLLKSHPTKLFFFFFQQNSLHTDGAQVLTQLN